MSEARGPRRPTLIPLRGDTPPRRFPAVTATLVAVNVAVFVFELLLPRFGLTLQGLFYKAGAIPYELSHGLDIPPRDLVPVWATMFTAMFLHGGWLHLIFNMLYLWIFGGNVEDAMTRPRFVAFYLASGLLATATQVAVAPGATAPMIGASGAVAGVLGAYLVLFPRARVISVVPLGIVFPVIEVPAWILLGLWFGLQALEGVLAFRRPDVGVAFFAHVGGFVAGACLVLLFTAGRSRRRPRRPA